MTDDTNKPALLETGEDARRWFAELGRPARLVFDLEADGLFSYEDKICLAQVACGAMVAIIDPLADREALAPLSALLADPGVAKIAHGADYDVRLLKKTLGFGPSNLFDTMIAAQMLGYEKLGLAALIERHFGVVLDKKHQRDDWSKRPLSESMLDYAAADVTRLETLADILKGELEEKGRLGWAMEEFRILEACEPPAPRRPMAVDVKGTQKLTPRQLKILQGLLEIRDETARRRDRPPFKIVANQVLIDWALTPPKSRAEVVGTRGMNRGVAEALAGQILAAVEKGLTAPESELIERPRHPRRPPPTQEESARLEKLKEVRTRVSGELSIDPGILVNTPTLERLSATTDADPCEALAANLKNWQREAVGEPLLAALAGNPSPTSCS